MWRRYIVGNLSFLSFAFRSAAQSRFGILAGDEYSFAGGDGTDTATGLSLNGSPGKSAGAHAKID